MRKRTGVLYGSGNRRITMNHKTVWVKTGLFFLLQRLFVNLCGFEKHDDCDGLRKRISSLIPLQKLVDSSFMEF